jgi:pimeloyl-ACP methyl ester carboxylesterase
MHRPPNLPLQPPAVRALARRCLLLAVCLAMISVGADASSVPAPEGSIIRVTSKDGTPIAVECAGSGPSLVIVHGGTGDRSRWKPLFPLFAPRFTVCAMDRRGHGASGDSPDYSLQKEAEDVAAVVNSRSGPVFLMGHSFGAVCALEAAFLTDKISKLVLYEPPLLEGDHTAIVSRMESMIQAGEREQATVTFLQEIVMISPSEVAAMKARPSWPGLVASIESSIRQIRALSAYRFDPKRAHRLSVPTLLLTGSETASPELKRSISGLLDSLPNRILVVFKGQQHNAMDTVPQQFAEAVTNFLLSPARKETPVVMRAHGTFEVKVKPETASDTDSTLGRMSIDKQFHGDLEGTSKGEMMTAGTAVKGSAGYVAIEKVSGTLQGRSGSFVLQHSGTMTRGAPQLTITVVPDSGTGQLEGLAGKMTIDIVEGKHFYDFEYTLAPLTR